MRRRLSEKLGVRVLLKREDLAHTGSAQDQQRARPGAPGTQRIGKRRMVAETGRGPARGRVGHG
jgi:tryptophan synthase beta chain